MRPALAVPLPQFFLFRCKKLPVVDRARLLHHPHKRRWLAFAYVLADFTHLREPAAKVITTVPKIELSANVTHIPFVQLRHTTTSASILNFAETIFAGAGGFRGREDTTSFGACA